MGTSTSPEQLTAKLNRLAAELRDTKWPLNVTALAGKQIFQASAGVLGHKVSR